jgi:hypothetical protein
MQLERVATPSWKFFAAAARSLAGQQKVTA